MPSFPTRHRNATYDGLHEPIIDRSLWDRMRAALAGNRTGERHIRAVVHPSILVGKLFDGTGQKMIASHASKGTRRYRYYVSRDLQHGGDAANKNGMRIPASEIEALVSTRLAELFDDPIGLLERASIPPVAPDVMAKAVAEARTIAETLRGSGPAAVATLIDQIVRRIDIAADAITITLDVNKVAGRLGIAVRPEIDHADSASPLKITVPAKLKRSGMAMRLILPTGQNASPSVDDRLVKAVATAHRWWEELVQNLELGVFDLAASHGVTESWVTRTLRLAFLDPTIVEQVLADKAPSDFTLEALRSPEAMPTSWSAQRPYHRIATAR